MSLKVYMDGKLVPQEEAKVSVWDHGLLYGDGVFEGIRAYSGRVFRLDRHLDRLWASALSIMLDIPLSREEMAEAVCATLRANGLHNGYVRLVVTRGIGDLGLDPRKCEPCPEEGRHGPSVIIIADQIALYPDEVYQNGLRIITCTTRRNIPDALNPGIKSLNYLNSILAKIETGRSGADEGIMLTFEGFVAECTGDNLFVVKGDKLITPPTSAGILHGITREAVMELAPSLGLEVREELFTLFDVYTAHELFLTGTAAEIAPVVDVDGRRIGSGRPGETTGRLLAAFRELTQREGTPIQQETGACEPEHA
jgi:branched-chain amino acid aminotransferase